MTEEIFEAFGMPKKVKSPNWQKRMRKLTTSHNNTAKTVNKIGAYSKRLGARIKKLESLLEEIKTDIEYIKDTMHERNNRKG